MGLPRKRRSPSLAMIVLLAVLALLFVFSLLELALKPTIEEFAAAEAEWRATKIIHKSVLENVAARVSYSDLIHIVQNDRQQVVYMEADVVRISAIASEAILAVQSELEVLQGNVVKIPLGQMLGSKLFANYGPPVSLAMIPLGTVKVFPEDQFTDAGINQTRHKISLKIECEIQVIIPFISRQKTVAVEVPIADAVIVGPVPEYYLNVDVTDGGAGLLSKIKP